MIQVSLDTSFLITFADPSRPNHQVALEYFEYFVANKVPMYLSTIAAGEFAVGQPLESLPLQNFRVQTYNLVHAKRSAHLFRVNRQLVAQIPQATPVQDGARPCVINDVKILAQAVEEEVSFIMAEDRNTLAKITNRLRDNGIIDVETRLLTSGFNPIGSLGSQMLIGGLEHEEDDTGGGLHEDEEI